MQDYDRIPIVNIVGPGSQPEPDEGILEYIAMPKDMDTFQQPVLPEPEDAGDIAQALALLDAVTDRLQQYSQAKQQNLFNLNGLNDASLELINQLLGVGEVSISIDGPGRIEIQESVMAGLWRVHHLDKLGKVVGDYLEIADIPAIAKQLAFENAASQVDHDSRTLPGGVINAPSVLTELDEKCRNFQPGSNAHVVNLTLLPLSDADLAMIGERVGVGPVTILSRGYGNCRIGSTACQNLWWIKYYNSEDALILNTIEVVDVPDVALAANEDIEDSAHRLSEMLEIYL